MSRADNKLIINKNYEVITLLAHGGMAEVYLARTLEKDKRTQKLVAIKKILPRYSSQPKFRQYFKREAQIAINMNHPNVVKSYRAHTDNPQELCLVVDYIKGRNLKQITTKLRSNKKNQNLDSIGDLKEKLEIEDVVYICREAARGLHYIHEYELFDKKEGEKPAHRDISPQNIMLGWEGEVKILDFGISKAKNVSSSKDGNTLDETTSIKGKFSYMSPEQAQGKYLDYRTDIFSLGVVMWELLSNGKRLFYRTSEIKTVQNILKCEIPSLSKINPNVPKEIEDLVGKLLVKNMHDRIEVFKLYESLNQFLNKNYPAFNPERLGEKFRKIFKEEYERDLIRDKKILSSTTEPKEQIISRLPDKTGINIKKTINCTTARQRVNNTRNLGKTTNTTSNYQLTVARNTALNKDNSLDHKLLSNIGSKIIEQDADKLKSWQKLNRTLHYKKAMKKRRNMLLSKMFFKIPWRDLTVAIVVIVVVMILANKLSFLLPSRLLDKASVETTDWM